MKYFHLNFTYCVKLRNQNDLMILCEKHLSVLILAISKYDSSTDDGGVLIEKMNVVLEVAVVKWQNFLFIQFLIDYIITDD